MKCRSLTLILVAVLLAAASCTSGAQIKALPIGSAMPNFTLKDSSGQEHSLASYKGKVVVLDFSSIECPYSRGVDEALNELATTYGPKGVVVLGVDSHKDVTPDQIKQYLADKKLAYSVVKDVKNAYADAAGASRTPEFFVLDKDQKLAYHGAFDDRKVPDKRGETPYVKNAVDDLLSGKPVKVAEVEAFGCTIKRAQ